MVTSHPKSRKDVSPGKHVAFTVKATGTNPLSYQWQWKPAVKPVKDANEEDGSEEWQSCDAEWCDGATLTIYSVQQFNEGSYRCVISNHAGSQISKAAQLSVGKNPVFKSYR